MSRFDRIKEGYTGFERNYERREGLHNEGEADLLAARDQWLANRIMEKVQQHYPGHPWRVDVEHHKNVGMAFLWMPGFSNWKMAMRISDLAVDPTMKLVVRLGGEFLERYNMPRTGIDLSSYLTAKAKYGNQWQWNDKPPE